MPLCPEHAIQARRTLLAAGENTLEAEPISVREFEVIFSEHVPVFFCW
jgi:hypothetical protein